MPHRLYIIHLHVCVAYMSCSNLFYLCLVGAKGVLTLCIVIQFLAPSRQVVGCLQEGRMGYVLSVTVATFLHLLKGSKKQAVKAGLHPQDVLLQSDSISLNIWNSVPPSLGPQLSVYSFLMQTSPWKAGAGHGAFVLLHSSHSLFLLSPLLHPEQHLLLRLHLCIILRSDNSLIVIMKSQDVIILRVRLSHLSFLV